MSKNYESAVEPIIVKSENAIRVRVEFEKARHFFSSHINIFMDGPGHVFVLPPLALVYAVTSMKKTCPPGRKHREF